MAEIVKANFIQHSKISPELQIHAAATLVVHGDPLNKDPKKRQDQAGEIAQFVFVVPDKFVGQLKRHHIDQGFETLKESIIQKLRAHGVMGAGE